MPISRRYTPEHAPGDNCTFGLSYEYVIPPGLGIVSGALKIFTNRVPPATADSDWEVGTVLVHGRVLYATLSGGVDGTDYQFRWTATDTYGNIWTRTTLLLCANTS